MSARIRFIKLQMHSTYVCVVLHIYRMIKTPRVDEFIWNVRCVR